MTDQPVNLPQLMRTLEYAIEVKATLDRDTVARLKSFITEQTDDDYRALFLDRLEQVS